MYSRTDILIVLFTLLICVSSRSQTTVWLSVFPKCTGFSGYDIRKIIVYDGNLRNSTKPSETAVKTVYRSYGMPSLTDVSQMFLLDFVFTKEDEVKLGSNKIKVAALHSCARDKITHRSALVWSNEFELSDRIDLNKAINRINLVDMKLTLPTNPSSP